MKYLKNISIIITTILIIFTSTLRAEVVNKIVVNGNDRIALETIAVFGDITIGKNYEAPDINLIIKKLYESSFFSKISVELKNNTLIINVEENAIVNSIVLQGEKAQKTKDAILENLKVKEKGSFISNNVKSDVNLMKKFYRSKGFYFVKIDAKIEELKNNRVNLVYTIDKGEKAKIAKIYFLGEKVLRDKKLRDIVTSQEARFWKFISKSVYLSKDRIDLDKRLLKSYYINKGYYEADITSSNVEYAEGQGFVLTFSIDAGTRYKFRKIYAEVDEALDKSAFSSLETDFSKLVGNYYSRKKLTNVLEEIDKLSELKELQFINHRIIETLDGNEIDVKINIFEGEKFVVERVNIVGNSVTNDSVIRGELIVDEGDPYSELLINKSINKIKGRNIFGKVTRKTLPGSSNDLKILEIEVEEKATGEIMMGAGIGSDGTSFQIAVKENNWLGRGIGLASDLNITDTKIRGSLNVTNPNYNFSGNSLTTGVNVSSTDRSSTSGYQSSSTGFDIGTKFEQYENIYIAPALFVTHEEIEAESTASSNIKKMDGTFFNTDLAYSIIADMRNQPFRPTDGYKASFTQSLPIIQDSSSILNTVAVSGYHSFSENVVGALKFNLKAINGIDEDVRLTKRLYVPKSKLRGFNVYQTGPKDGDDYIGGNYVGSLNAEAQLPNLLPESYKTDFYIFLDTANVWEVDYSNTINETNKIRSSIGASANVFTVVGPLNFTFAQSITKASTDQTETFSFNLGTSF